MRDCLLCSGALSGLAQVFTTKFVRRSTRTEVSSVEQAIDLGQRVFASRFVPIVSAPALRRYRGNHAPAERDGETTTARPSPRR